MSLPKNEVELSLYFLLQEVIHCKALADRGLGLNGSNQSLYQTNYEAIRKKYLEVAKIVYGSEINKQ